MCPFAFKLLITVLFIEGDTGHRIRREEHIGFHQTLGTFHGSTIVQSLNGSRNPFYWVHGISRELSH